MDISTFTFEVEELIYKILINSPLKEEITGKIFRSERPTNRTNEDIIINSLPLGQSNHQNGIVNINIHVKDQYINIDGESEYMPNNSRLKELNNLVVEAIRNAKTGRFGLKIANQATFPEQGVNEHINNIRVLINILN